MASKYLSTGTATYTALTRAISAATMTPIFEAADQSEQRQVFFRIGADLFYGAVESFVSGTSVTLLARGVLPAGNGTIAELFVLDLSEAHSYQDYIAELQSLIKDDAVKLTVTSGGDLDKILAKAVRDYSAHKPFIVRKKVQGNGTAEYALSTIFGSLWRHGYSSIREFEYPIGTKPRDILDSSLYEIYDDGSAQDGSNLKLRFVDSQPAATAYFIAEFSIEMDLPRAGTQNFPDTDENFSNITVLSAAYACQRLAAAYAQSSDATITADVVNYHDKSSRYQSLARQYLKQYNLAVFGKEEPEASVEAAMASKPMYPTDNEGNQTLFHRRRK
jgi:hypothetical protein